MLKAICQCYVKLVVSVPPPAPDASILTYVKVEGERLKLAAPDSPRLLDALVMLPLRSSAVIVALADVGALSNE